MATVAIENVHKSYGKSEVIHGIDLDIAEGELVSLIGASGCGKSTLLRMIAGLETITSGTVSLDGRTINDVAPKNRDIAMVFQNYALYPHLTVFDNMGFSLRLRKVPKPEIETAVKHVADFLGLADYLDRYPKELSGGQRQRVAMGRAIVREPQVFLFDEPLSNLDAKLRVQMRVEIKALQKRLGTTSIYVTHDQMEAMTLSDRIVVLNEGRVEQFGDPLEVYDHPANTFVAAFIGSPSMNMFEGHVTRDGNTTAVRTGDITIPVNADLADGKEVIVGIRPEHLTLADTDDSTVRLPFVVDLVEPTGAALHVYGRIADTEVTATFQGRPALHSGEQVELAAQKQELHLFDRETGDRVN